MNKAILKELRAIAETLPTWFVDSHENHLMKGVEVLAETEYKEIEGKPIDPDKTYVIAFPVQVAYNHYRYLKKLYNEGGMKACKKYQLECLTEHCQETIINTLQPI